MCEMGSLSFSVGPDASTSKTFMSSTSLVMCHKTSCRSEEVSLWLLVATLWLLFMSSWLLFKSSWLLKSCLACNESTFETFLAEAAVSGCLRWGRWKVEEK